MPLKEMLEKKNELITRAEAILDLAKAEKRELTDEESKELAQLRDNAKKIAGDMEAAEEIRSMGRVETKDAKPEDKPDAEMEQRAIEEAEERAFDAYIRGIVLETRDDPTPVNMTKAANGAIIPTTIANRIIKRVYDVAPILARSNRYNVKGTLAIPYYAETAGTAAITVAYQDEFVPLVSNVGSFSSINLTGFLAGALTLISRSLINNAQFNVTNEVVTLMGDSIARFIEGELIKGTAGKVAGLSGISTSVTAAAASAITADEIVKLHDAIKDAYQQNAIWVMSPETRTALRLLKGNDGHYLLNDDISSPFGTSLLGKPVFASDNMPNMATGVSAIIYGDMSGLATKFNEEISIEVLRERYADQHAVGVISWFEFDAKVQDQQKLAKLVMA